MSECTHTTAVDEPGLTLETLLKVRADLDAMLPRLLYHTTKYMPALDLDGNPMVMKVCPSKMDAHFVREAWEYISTEDFILIHPDNLPGLKRACVGIYRLEPMVMAKQGLLP